MLRVGLTGGLGSGKSTVAAMLAERGAHVIQADEVAREMMRPGQAVYAAIVERFGPDVVGAGGELERAKLARLAFDGDRLEELNAIVHPAVIARQAEMAEEIGRLDPEPVIVVESALIFETQHGGEGGWRRRFDLLVLVTASEELRIDRFVKRLVGTGGSDSEVAAAREEACRRLRRQMPDSEKEIACEYVLRNEGTLLELETEVNALWRALLAAAAGARL